MFTSVRNLIACLRRGHKVCLVVPEITRGGCANSNGFSLAASVVCSSPRRRRYHSNKENSKNTNAFYLQRACKALHACAVSSEPAK